MKKIIEFIFHPFLLIGNSKILTKITSAFNSRKWPLYVLTSIITLLIVFFLYIFPNI
ncbi:MAG: hypothetical protein GX312_00610 [Candidatus Phytoplasma sp.]|nr:hypothetical protein [Phytoplasma sp.]